MVVLYQTKVNLWHLLFSNHLVLGPLETVFGARQLEYFLLLVFLPQPNIGMEWLLRQLFLVHWLPGRGAALLLASSCHHPPSQAVINSLLFTPRRPPPESWKCWGCRTYLAHSALAFHYKSSKISLFFQSLFITRCAASFGMMDYTCLPILQTF